MSVSDPLHLRGNITSLLIIPVNSQLHPPDIDHGVDPLELVLVSSSVQKALADLVAG